ncbi:MAG: O-antigen ligase domain-containing protein, partial [Acetobacteraceae bacterium]|nr:O-antigen ligase domain-containing protein [Acetobacteraceae bacterium]
MALLAGMAAAILQMAGALKTAPPLAGLPVDLTLASLALLLPALALLAVSRRWRVDRAIALPLAAAGLFWVWLVVGAEPSARRALAATTIAIGALLAAIVAWGVLGGWGLAALLDPEAQRLQYQLAGLAMATAAALAAVKLVEAPSWPGRAAWAVLILALAAAALLP